MNTTEQYALLIEAKLNAGEEKVTQYAAIEVANSGLVWFYRTTDGKRGAGNSWAVSKNITLDNTTLFVEEPRTIALTPGQKKAVEKMTTDGTIPSQIFSDLQKRITAPFAKEMANGEVIALIENAFTNERELLEKWNRGLDQVTIEIVEQKKAEPQLWFTSRPRLEYSLPQQQDDLYSWATLSVPDPDTIENKRYVEREIAGLTLSQWFEHSLDRGKSVVISGPAGTGKTSAGYNFAAKLGVPFTTFECNPQLDKSDIQGKYVPAGNGNELIWRYSALATAISQEGVVLLNEVTRMTPKANSLFMSLLAEKRLIIDQHHNEIIPVHPRCLIIADANPDYRGTMLSDEAFQDRFLVKLEFEYDEQIEEQFIPSENLLEMAKELRRASSVEGKFSTPISTRLLISFIDVALDLGYEPAVYNFINSFPPSEREPLTLIFSTYEENILEDLANVKVAN